LSAAADESASRGGDHELALLPPHTAIHRCCPAGASWIRVPFQHVVRGVIGIVLYVVQESARRRTNPNRRGSRYRLGRVPQWGEGSLAVGGPHRFDPSSRPVSRSHPPTAHPRAVRGISVVVGPAVQGCCTGISYPSATRNDPERSCFPHGAKNRRSPGVGTFGPPRGVHRSRKVLES
jgi:hypothetical protein